MVRARGIAAFGFALVVLGAASACAQNQSQTLPSAKDQLSPPATMDAARHVGSSAESLLYRFQGYNDGRGPDAGLLEDSKGNLYGTAAYAGFHDCEEGCGTVFKLSTSSPSRGITILQRFNGTDGYWPYGSLIIDKRGALYGTTWAGGTNSCYCGLVFKLTPNGSNYVENILHSFAGSLDGNGPLGALIEDPNGALYGTTYFGGGPGCNGGCGTVFRLKPTTSAYVESVVYAFQGGTDGAGPTGTLTMDAAGALYGTTEVGGNHRCGYAGCGTVFKLTPNGSSYRKTTIYTFKGLPDGDTPIAALIVDKRGALYGTTFSGGNGHCRERGYSKGCGTVYKLMPEASGYSEQILYQFGTSDGNGTHPDAAIVMDSRGVLYGTTATGGAISNCGGLIAGCGTIFKLVPRTGPYKESVLHSFLGTPNDGKSPRDLTLDPSGTLYGTTYEGGWYGCGLGCGLVFKLSVR
jgi:uncharacterized repeat protein (TIGR03803 family)